jgi:hypothetical protein
VGHLWELQKELKPVSRSFHVLAAAVLVLLLCPAIANAAAILPAECPVQDFPFGVQWPWERTDSIAKNAGTDKWAFTRRTCKLLKDKGVDSIWLVNIDVGDLKPLLKITRPLGLKLIPCLGEIEPKNCRGTMGVDLAATDFKAKALAYYARKIPQIVQDIGEDRAGVLAWALCDEPTGVCFDLMDPTREIFAKADPDRPALAVSTWPQTPDLIAKTRLTTFCIDLYPFCGPNDPNGPQPPTASGSRDFYSKNIQRMVKDAGKDGRVGWVFAMCFAEIWGPKEMKPDGFVSALPGAYVHWRTPTLAEMRWQIWEGLRLGVKGLLFYVLLGEAEGDPNAKLPDDPSLRSVLAKTIAPVGYSGLLDRKGDPTPQCNEMSMLFRKLAPHKALLRKLTPNSTQWLAAEGGTQIGSFVDSVTGERYAVAVNPDFSTTQTVTLTVAADTHDLVDMFTGKSLKLQRLTGAGGGFRTKISLKAGDGVLLKR